MYRPNYKGAVPKKPGKYPVFTRADTLRGTLLPERAAFDVRYYELTIRPDMDRKTLEGSVAITFSVTRETRRIQLDLNRRLHIRSVCENAVDLYFVRDDDALWIEFDSSLSAGTMKTITISYGGKPQIARQPPWKGGLVWKKDKRKNPWIGVACEDEGASIWWPLKDHIADEPDSVGINIVTPKGLMGVANGRLTEVVQGPGEGSAIWKWRTSYPVNNYNVTFYIGDYRRVVLPYEADSVIRELEFYVLPDSEDKARKHFEQTADIIRFFEKTFGEYPWWNDGFKMVESPYEGMEHQSAIAYGNRYKNIPGYNFDYIILHEAAHEWWGNSLTAQDMAELWLHEGFATYSEALYVEEKFGFEAYQTYLLGYRADIQNRRPLIGPMGVGYANFKDGDIYTKGAWFLHSLRYAIGDDSLFMDIIRTFAVEFRQKTVSTNDFLNLVNRKTGKDYAWMFEQYLYQRKSPVLVYSCRFGYPWNTLTFYWENTVEGFNLPVHARTEAGTFYARGDKEPRSVMFKGERFSLPFAPYYYGTKRIKEKKLPVVKEKTYYLERDFEKVGGS